ncbi:hypothetical protein SEA_BABYYODA_53 [Microbacterium phage BabyYoda]|nr:hypothetical protein SEA_BABYYODA_53 [Microbacterium phage BabyYoda]
MNKYDQPPIVLTSDLKTVFEHADEPRFTEAHISTQPARFLVFMGEKKWVLRSYRFGKDYPFVTQAGARAGVVRLAELGYDPYAGSPIELNAYGEPAENVEVIA